MKKILPSAICLLGYLLSFSQTSIYNKNFIQDAEAGWFESFKILREGNQVGAIGTDGVNKIQFFTGPGSDATTARLTIDAHGKIGIGTDAPTERLAVNGNIHLLNTGNKIYWDWTSRTIEQYSSDGGVSKMIRFRNSMNASNPNGGFDFATDEGVSVLRINQGKVGIGTDSPTEMLDVNGNIHLLNTGNKIYWDWTNRTIEQYSSDGGASRMIRFRNSMDASNPDGGFDFATHEGVSVLRINQGRVGIGTTNLGDANYLLSVNGTIRSKEIKVDADWSDFVFEKDYNLLTLEEVEQHISERGHLPEIPSEAEVTANGINLGEMDSKLLQKIEELTLYLIEQNKEIKALKAEVARLKRH